MMETNLTKRDIAALKLAMDYASRDPDRKEQLEEKLLEEPWIEVAQFAAYHCQMESLQLDPADNPPCWIDDPAAALKGPNDDAWCWGAHEAARLLKKMITHGVSKYHPDPVKAIEQAETRGL